MRCEIVAGPFDGGTRNIPDLEEYLKPTHICAEGFLAILDEGSKPGPEQKFRLYRYRREALGKMIYPGSR
jgi:hypothetical protein